MMRFFIFCAGFISMLGLTGFGDDTLYIRSLGGAKVAILVNGQFEDGGWALHSLFGPTRDSIIDIGRISSRPGMNGQVIVFPEKGPVALLDNVRWSDQPDRDIITLQQPIVLPIRFRVRCGDDSEMRDKALCAYLHARQRLFEEHTGIELGNFRIDFVGPCGREIAPGNFICLARDAVEKLGYDSTCINVYYIDSVDNTADRGAACDYSGNFIALASRTSPDILIHELGHLMTLAHTDGADGFDTTNIMCSASNSRRFFSEGQISRAHLAGNSVLNRLRAPEIGAGSRFGTPRRGPTYDHIPPSNEGLNTPRLNTRIWEGR